MSQLSTSGYGLTPRVISSHRTTPYDHCAHHTNRLDTKARAKKLVWKNLDFLDLKKTSQTSKVQFLGFFVYCEINNISYFISDFNRDF